jgi:hypothetical protein
MIKKPKGMLQMCFRIAKILKHMFQTYLNILKTKRAAGAATELFASCVKV